MIDLTGANLVAYLLRVIRDIVERHPRFKETLGSVTFPANTIIAWKDVWVSIRSVTTSGTRLSPDYFMCTQLGRAILAKVADHEGQFIEWVREVDKTRLTPESGVYYINVDFVDEKTRDIGLTSQKFKWKDGKIVDAEGSQVFFRPNLIGLVNGIPVQPGDITTLEATDATTGGAIQFVAYNSSLGGFMNLLTPVQQLVLKFPGGSPLQPLVDYWYQRVQTSVICESTLGGAELISTPPNVGISIYDQDGYVLRPNIDYVTYGNGFIQLAEFSPAGSKLFANATVKLNPYEVSGTNPENILQIGLEAGESLAPGQVFIHTTSGDYPGLSTNSDGTITLPVLMQPGESLRWEVRIETPQIRTTAKKWELNSLVIVDPNTILYSRPDAVPGEPTPIPVQASAGTPLLDANAQQQYALPGLHLAIGDQVVVGDQCAIIVSPSISETYEVFGSKENIGFTLEVKANDLQTASDLSEMLKQQLLIMRRENTEADGLTIFEATRDFQGVQRDASATAPSYIYTVTISASADWKVYVPLVTRLVSYEIINVAGSNPDFQGKLQMANRLVALGTTQFIQQYG